MSSGPSKQELEMYWQNSRQYFDELAKHYQIADPAYYREFIEPFYNNPFRTSQPSPSGKSSGGKAILAIAVFMVLLIGGIAAFLFIYLGSESDGNKEIEKLFNTDDSKKEVDTKKEEPVKEVPAVEEPTEPGELSSDDNFIIGSKYIAEKKYDKAEYHLKKVKPGTTYYEQSKQLLESMKFLRKYDK